MGSSSSPSSIGAHNHIISVHTVDSGIDDSDAIFSTFSYEVGMRNMLENYQIESVTIQQAAEIETLITETLHSESSTLLEQFRTSLHIVEDQRQPHEDSDADNSVQRETSRNSIIRTSDAIEIEEEEFNNGCYESMYWNLVCNICNRSSGFRSNVRDAEQDVVIFKPTAKTMVEECVPLIKSQKTKPPVPNRDFQIQIPDNKSNRTNVVTPGGGGDGPIETFLTINGSMKELETMMSVMFDEEAAILTEDDGMEEEMRALPYSEEILRQELAEIDQVITLSFSSSSSDSGRTAAEEALRRELAEADRLIASAYAILNHELDAIDHVIALSTSGSFERQVKVPVKAVTTSKEDDDFMNISTQPVCAQLDGWCSTEEARTTAVFEERDESSLATPFASNTNQPPESLRVADPVQKQCQVPDTEPNVITPSESFHAGPQVTTKGANREETNIMHYVSSSVGPDYSISDPIHITEDNLSHSQNPSDEKSSMHLARERASTFPTGLRHDFMPEEINKSRSYNRMRTSNVEATTPELQSAPHQDATVLPLQPPAPVQPFLTSAEGDKGGEVSSISSSSSNTPNDQYVLKFGRTDSLISSITASDDSENSENKLSASGLVDSPATKQIVSVLELAQNMSQELWEGLARDFATFEEELRDICDASAASPINPQNKRKMDDMSLPRIIPVPRKVYVSVAKSKEQFYRKSHAKSANPAKAVNTTDITEGTSQSDQIHGLHQVRSTLVESQTPEESKGCSSEKFGSETMPGKDTSITSLQAQWYKQIGELEQLGRKLMTHLGKMESGDDRLMHRTVDSSPCQNTNPPRESNMNVRHENERVKIVYTASWSPTN